MFGYSLKRWFASAFGPAGFARPFWRHLERSLVPGQANACQNALCVGGHGAWHGITFARALAAKGRDLHSVQFLPDAGRTHRVAEHVQPLAQVLQAAKGHITDRDMSPDPLWGPVIDGPDFEIMFVGAEARFDFPQLVISGNNILSVQIVCTVDQNSMKAIPLCCVLDPGFVNRNIASVGERQETTIPTTAEAGRLAAALELFLGHFPATLFGEFCSGEIYNTNERMSYSFFGMPNCFTLVATQVPLGISKKE